MTTGEIIQNNKNICECLGISWHGNGTVGGYPSVIPFQMGTTTIETCKFNSDWNWIIPAWNMAFREFSKLINDGKPQISIQFYARQNIEASFYAALNRKDFENAAEDAFDQLAACCVALKKYFNRTNILNAPTPNNIQI